MRTKTPLDPTQSIHLLNAATGMSSSSPSVPPPGLLPPSPPVAGGQVRRPSLQNTNAAQQRRSLHLNPDSRFVKRNLPFRQSSNTMNVSFVHQQRYLFGSKFLGDIFLPNRITQLKRMDWYHLYLRLPTYISFFLLLLVWTTSILCFTGIYIGVDSFNPAVDCGLSGPGGTVTFNTAFAFSLETTTTVGYGLPGGSNGFFNNCPGLQIAIYLQMMSSIAFNAFLFAFIFARLARCERRGYQVVWGDKAVVNKVGGKYFLDVRVFDVDA
ncbi:hypothetical protein TeGR_g14970, partial [Tetraparma gracilis]